MRDADRLGMHAVYVDFYGVLSVHEIALRIEHAYRSGLEGPVQRAVGAIVRSLRPRAHAGVPGTGVELSPAPEDDDLRLLHRLLDLPVRVWERTQRRTLVVFDEFQALLAASPALDGLIRSRIQHHDVHASYVFAGSHPGLMRELFANRERPFFQQARDVPLGPLADEDLAEHIAAAFELTGRDPGPALDPLLDFAAGHPQRSMLLAHFLWEQTPPRRRADEATWLGALEGALRDQQAALQAIWDGLDDGERRTYAAALNAGGRLTRPALGALGIAPTTAYSARDRLIAEGDLDRRGGRLAPVDPLFAEWVRRGRRTDADG
jgi:uncharacterized protein